ncbi:flavodoxin family protein [Thermococcus barophilus]|uniref:Flavodoxin-like domain-containing protein n=1 Tax=Thermococcus barophilus TaxID=55802 RepID=A0A0S1XCG1_THEBA|nr:flavodoxin domain-containing protein [Thermococcus barophilus]ALM75486.1 hypothetical protein TBCH5v1_1573 [Thermococcus barophilus]
MRVCIVYNTKRGSTERVARAMAKAVEGIAEVRVFRVTENPDVESCDLIVIGAPIYYERPLPSVIEFIRSRNGLESKRVAVFILCIADKFGKLGKKYTEARYMRLMTEPIKGEIIAKRVFDGWILKEDPKTIREAENWIKRVLDAFKSGEELGIEHPEGE